MESELWKLCLLSAVCTWFYCNEVLQQNEFEHSFVVLSEVFLVAPENSHNEINYFNGHFGINLPPWLLWHKVVSSTTLQNGMKSNQGKFQFILSSFSSLDPLN